MTAMSRRLSPPTTETEWVGHFRCAGERHIALTAAGTIRVWPEHTAEQRTLWAIAGKRACRCYMTVARLITLIRDSAREQTTRQLNLEENRPNGLRYGIDYHRARLHVEHELGRAAKDPPTPGWDERVTERTVAVIERAMEAIGLHVYHVTMAPNLNTHPSIVTVPVRHKGRLLRYDTGVLSVQKSWLQRVLAKGLTTVKYRARPRVLLGTWDIVGEPDAMLTFAVKAVRRGRLIQADPEWGALRWRKGKWRYLPGMAAAFAPREVRRDGQYVEIVDPFGPGVSR